MCYVVRVRKDNVLIYWPSSNSELLVNGLLKTSTADSHHLLYIFTTVVGNVNSWSYERVADPIPFRRFILTSEIR